MECPMCDTEMMELDENEYVCPRCGEEITPQDIDNDAYHNEMDNRRHAFDEQGDW